MERTANPTPAEGEAGLSKREHARLSRALIAACGGLDEAKEACRVSKSKLSDYQNPTVGLFMPADVIADLELYCGAPVYSAALVARFNASTVAGDLRAATCALTEGAADLQHRVRTALSDGHFTQRELDEIAETERATEVALEHVRATRRAAEAQLEGRHLRAV